MDEVHAWPWAPTTPVWVLRQATQAAAQRDDVAT